MIGCCQQHQRRKLWVEGSFPATMREDPHKDQLEEVRVGSQASCSIFGDGNSLFSFDNFSEPEEGPQLTGSNKVVHG